MVECAVRNRIPAYRHGVEVVGRPEPRSEPVGAWVEGLGPGLDLVMGFLPGCTEARGEVSWTVNPRCKRSQDLARGPCSNQTLRNR